MESELFGHVKGAYTGAERNRMGRFEAARDGSIFLDEIGDIPPATQIKLLRVLEEKEIERVGDHRPVKVDVRIITATNRDLEKLVADGTFREDLFFRINVFPLHCPSLSERLEDIPLIVRNFIKRNNRETGKNILGLAPEAMEILLSYDWPGNVRELRNAVEYAFVLCPEGHIRKEHLPPKIGASRPTSLRQRRFESGRVAGHFCINPQAGIDRSFENDRGKPVEGCRNSGCEPRHRVEAAQKIRNRSARICLSFGQPAPAPFEKVNLPFD